MKKFRMNPLFLVIGIFVCMALMPILGIAGPRDRLSDSSEATENPGDADAFLDDLALGDIVKIEGSDVWIRLTPGQFRSSKAVSRVKRRGRVRIVLRPRQILALEKAIGSDTHLSERVLHINAVDLRRSRLPKERVESHFVVKPVSDFNS
jgi:hypothetical protein